jgi:hypothetical protein
MQALRSGKHCVIHGIDSIDTIRQLEPVLFYLATHSPALTNPASQTQDTLDSPHHVNFASFTTPRQSNTSRRRSSNHTRRSIIQFEIRHEMTGEESMMDELLINSSPHTHYTFDNRSGVSLSTGASVRLFGQDVRVHHHSRVTLLVALPHAAFAHRWRLPHFCDVVDRVDSLDDDVSVRLWRATLHGLVPDALKDTYYACASRLCTHIHSMQMDSLDVLHNLCSLEDGKDVVFDEDGLDLATTLIRKLENKTATALDLSRLLRDFEELHSILYSTFGSASLLAHAAICLIYVRCALGIPGW